MPEENKEYVRAKKIAFQLLKFRDRSEKEIISRLKFKKVSQGSIDKTINFLRKIDLLADDRFACSWVKLCVSKQLGIRRIALELKQKGIKEELIEELIGNLKEEYKESDIALELAQNKLKRLSNIDEHKAKQRVYSLLLRKGFSYDTVNDVLSQL